MSYATFTSKCPQCGGRMATGNKYCSMKCYKEANDPIPMQNIGD